MSDLTRRDLVKAMAVTGAAASTGCLKMSDSAARKTEASAVLTTPVLERTALPRLGPWPTLDPFLFCVHHDDRFPVGNGALGPKPSLSGRRIGQDFSGKDGWSMYHGDTIPGFPRHPHRGFETVTAVSRGLVDHADSLGASARYGEGDVQWLTAGDGINHAEMMPLCHTDKANPLDLFQIWLNLPAKNKRVSPRFFMHWRDQIPVHRHRDAGGKQTEVTVIAGELAGQRAAAPPPDSYASQSGSSVGIWHIAMEAGAEWTLPGGPPSINRALYTVAGDGVTVMERGEPMRHRLKLKSDREVSLKAPKGPIRLLLLQGKPIDEPVVQHGPFVMNTRAEIMEAISDYKRTQFGGWPWPSTGPVHGHEIQRFARHADGRMDTPG